MNVRASRSGEPECGPPRRPPLGLEPRLPDMSANPTPAAVPWFRQRWPWLLIAGPAIVVVAGISTAIIAIRTDDGLVAEDYYKRGLAINQTLERTERAAALSLVAVVDVAADGTTVVVLDGEGDAIDVTPAALRLRLAHPTRAGEDRAATLVPVAPGRYAGRVAPPSPGRWRIIVETDRWRLPPVENDGTIRGVVIASGAR